MKGATVTALDTLTLDGIARATHGDVRGAPATAVSGVSIDSRTIGPGQLFVAVKGPRFDGHEFVTAALERGAAAAMVHRDVAAPESFPLVRVAERILGTVQLPGALSVIGAATVLVGAAVVASLVPAMRASRIDVLHALRSE